MVQFTHLSDSPATLLFKKKKKSILITFTSQILQPEHFFFSIKNFYPVIKAKYATKI